MSKFSISRTLNGLILIGLVMLITGCMSSGFVKPSPERAEAANLALKASLDLPVTSPNSVALRLMRQEYSLIETEYRQTLESYQQNVSYESPLQKGFDLFFPGNQVVLKYIDAWVEATGSDIAYAARGYYKMAQASSVRGNDYINKVSRENLQAMQRYCNEAASDFQIAVQKNPELTPAWIGLVRIGMIAAMPFSADDMFQEAIKHDRRSFYLRQQYMKSLEPRWGGSYDTMAAFASRCARDADLNPRIWLLLGSIYADQANLLSQQGDHPHAAEMYSQALQYGDRLDWLQYRANSLSKYGEYDKAVTDLEKILYYSPDHENATVMMTRIKQQQSGKG
jgi:tetratricopeptide (TPR) repeat protein